MFPIKAALVEKVAQWRMNLYLHWLQMGKDDAHLSRTVMFHLFRSRYFDLRRELWTKSIPELQAEAKLTQTERLLVAASA